MSRLSGNTRLACAAEGQTAKFDQHITVPSGAEPGVWQYTARHLLNGKPYLSSSRGAGISDAVGGGSIVDDG